MASSAVFSFLASSKELPLPVIRKNDLISTRGKMGSLPLPIRSTLADNAGLLQAAKHTVNTYIKSGMVIGLGSGLASGLATQYLGRQLRAGVIKDIVGVPTSVSSASEAAKAGIPLDQFQDNSQIDFAFNDADAMEEGTLAAVIGRQRVQGEESLIQEKTIMKAAGKLVLMVTGKQYKFKGGLEGSIPVLIKSYNWMETAEEIDDLFLGDAEVWRRASVGHADPLGGDFPVITREGHNVLDVIFTSPIPDLAEVADTLDKIDGVVEHGVISKILCTAVIAAENGLCVINSVPKGEVCGL